MPNPTLTPAPTLSKFRGMRSQTAAAVLRPLPLVFAAAYLFMTHFAPDHATYTDVLGRKIEGQPLNSSGFVLWYAKDATAYLVDALVIGTLMCLFVWLGLRAKPVQSK